MPHLADYSFARPDPVALRAAGYDGVLRYVCQSSPSTAGKIINKDEYDRLQAAGLQVLLNYEWNATRPLSGYAAGVEDAHVADSQADAVGYPLDWPIYYSSDSSATYPQVVAYYQGVHLASRRPVGFYGGMGVGLQLLRDGLVQKLWVANAASWSGFGSWSTLRANVDPSAHIIQHLDHPLGFVGAVDHNETLRDDYAGGTTRGLFVSLSPAQEMQVADAAVKVERLYDIIFGKAGEPANFITDIHDKLVPVINAHVDAKIAEVEARIAAIQPGGGSAALSDADIERIRARVLSVT